MDPLSKSQDSDITRPNPPHGARVGVYTALGALSGVIALPWLPDTVARRVRGALAQDLCSRHGVALTPEARAVLSEPDADVLSGKMGAALRFVALRWLKRFSPLGFLPPVRSAVSTFALGHLMDRYFVRHRKERATRMDVEEAKHLRALVDKAVVELLRTDLQVPRDNVGAAPEDLRDGVTQLIDGVVIAVASVPDMITRRLDAAFDAVVKRT